MPGSTTTRPSGLATCEAIFARCLVRATPIEIGRPSSAPHPAPDRARNFGGRAEQMRAARHIGEGFVDGDALDQRREIVEHLDDRIAEPLVVAEMAADKDQVRTELARPQARHAACDPEALWLRRKRPARPRRRRRWACRAATGRAVARPRHRRRRGPRGGWWLSFPSRSTRRISKRSGASGF